MKNIPDIDAAIENLNVNIQSVIESCVSKPPNKNSPKHLPIEVLREIREKNLLRREWQQNHDPVVKIRLNAKIFLIRTLLQIHKLEE